MPLYKTQSPYQAAVGALGSASQTASAMTKKTEIKKPSKTAGDAIAAGIGGALGGMGVAELYDPGTGKALYDTVLKGLFGAPENAAASLAAGQTAASGIEAATGTAVGGAAQNLTTGGAAMLGAAAPLETAAAGTAAATTATGSALTGASGATAGAAGLGAAGTTGATTAALSEGAALSGMAGAGGTAAGGAAQGSAAGPAGAAIGAGIGLALGLASYFL